ncbi:hypothetical protein [Streptomyces sp. NPDC048277]|uniref:hypothetical protein n=1 Tax=Streptomyces sp. NPDC048277 TaxID=3155027 RepID=UPI0033DB35A6
MQTGAAGAVVVRDRVLAGAAARLEADAPVASAASVERRAGEAAGAAVLGRAVVS